MPTTRTITAFDPSTDEVEDALRSVSPRYQTLLTGLGIQALDVNWNENVERDMYAMYTVGVKTPDWNYSVFLGDSGIEIPNNELFGFVWSIDETISGTMIAESLETFTAGIPGIGNGVTSRLMTEDVEVTDIVAFIELACARVRAAVEKYGAFTIIKSKA